MGLLGNDALAMSAVVVASLVLSLAVLLIMVRPWELPEPEDDETGALVTR